MTKCILRLYWGYAGCRWNKIRLYLHPWPLSHQLCKLAIHAHAMQEIFLTFTYCMAESLAEKSGLMDMWGHYWFHIYLRPHHNFNESVQVNGNIQLLLHQRMCSKILNSHNETPSTSSEYAAKVTLAYTVCLFTTQITNGFLLHALCCCFTVRFRR